MMPAGILIDCLSVFLGGLTGAVVRKVLKEQFAASMNLILGLASMGMGISSIVLMKNMPAVVFALIIGTALGLVLHLGSAINHGVTAMFHSAQMDEDQKQQMITAVVLFCASGTGIYGALISGMNGDQTILIAKAILDFFTAMIFATQLGWKVSLIAIPQVIIFLILFFLAGRIVPLTDDTMIADFKACGGFIMLATGFRMVKLKEFPIADMIPAMILVMPFSAFWINVLIPFIG